MRSFIVGIAGGSGSGKTTLARELREILGDRAAILYQDSYYIDQSHRFDGDGGSVNFDHPESLEFDLLAKHLDQLRQGQAIEVPQYDFATHTRLSSTTRFAPSEVVILDGTLLLSQPVIRERLDLCVFVDTAESLRFQRRLNRDVRERGRTEDGVRRQFEKQVKPMHDLFVEPSKEHAHRRVLGTEQAHDCALRIVKEIRALRGAAL